MVEGKYFYDDDPYVYPGTMVLKNKLGIKDLQTLSEVEKDFSLIRLRVLEDKPLPGSFDYEHFMSFHRFIFEKVYEWAGEPRSIDIEKPEKVLGGHSVEYSAHQDIKRDITEILNQMGAVRWENLSATASAKTLATFMGKLWKVHPFREGNTRTTVTFILQFANERGITLNRQHFARNSRYLRNALVAAAAYYSDMGDYSKPEYLINFVKDSFVAQQRLSGIQDRIAKAKASVAQTKGYSRPEREER